MAQLLRARDDKRFPLSRTYEGYLTSLHIPSRLDGSQRDWEGMRSGLSVRTFQARHRLKGNIAVTMDEAVALTVGASICVDSTKFNELTSARSTCMHMCRCVGERARECVYKCECECTHLCAYRYLPHFCGNASTYYEELYFIVKALQLQLNISFLWEAFLCSFWRLCWG